MWTVCWSTSKKHAYWRSPAGGSQWERPHSKSVACYENASKTQRASEKDLLRLQCNRWKRELVETYVGRYDSVIDIGCGRGGDLAKLAHRQVSTYTGVDSSPMALEEACSRAVNLKMNVSLGLLDVTKHEAGVVAPQSNVGICMFALHYFVETEESTERLARFLKLHLKPSAKFVGICPDAREIRHRLQDEDTADDGTVALSWVDEPTAGYACKIVSDAGDVLVDAQETLINWPAVERIFERVAGLGLTLLIAGASSACPSMPIYSAFVFEPIVRDRDRSGAFTGKKRKTDYKSNRVK
jgi:trans-aconitate methyltransferase